MMQILNMDNLNAAEWNTALHVTVDALFGLYSRSGERMKDDELAWTVMKDLSTVEYLEYRMVPKKVSIMCSDDNDVRLDLDVDLSQPLRNVMPLFWRRFGVDGKSAFLGIRILGATHDLTMDASLIDQNIRPGCTLQMTIQANTAIATVATGDNINIWLED